MKTFHWFTIVILGILLSAASVVPSAAQKRKSSDSLTPKQVKELVENAKTPADHMKLSQHFAALAAKYETDATDHEVLAKVYRSGPNAAETKRPGSPDTALHCDRFAQLARDAAKEARELAAAHEHMATAVK